jgi:hypothetical protein
METLGIMFLTGFLGYQISNSKQEEIRNVSENDIEVPLNEKPNSKNIYNSNRVNEINDEILQMSIGKYKESENPSLTGVLPPIYNSYSVVGQDNNNLQRNLSKDPSLKALSDINHINRYTNPLKTDKPNVEQRPMFKTSYEIELPTDFSNFGSGESSSKQISLLTGLPIEKDHSNMVPFFGSNVRQNVEEFANVATLDNYTGNNDTFFHKQEQSPRFENKKQDIYGTISPVEQDRYIQSIYKQGEKPFYQEKISAPIANTLNNPITNAAASFKTIDQLRTANNEQISYEGLTKTGQFGSVRGIQSKVNKNRVDMSFELGSDRLFTDTGAITKNTSKYNFENLQSTSRQNQNLEYYGSAISKETLKTEPRYSIDNTNEFSVLVQPSTRQSLTNDYTRNVNKTTNNNSDYGKNSFNLPELERNTTNTMHTLNINKQGTETQMGLLDNVRNTIKQTTLSHDNSGQMSNRFIKSDTNAVENGMSNYNFKTTNKETLVDKNYIGQPMKKDQTGYTINKYNAKTTNKEITADNEYQGTAGKVNGKNSMIYSTWANPEKIRNASHTVNYTGNANGYTQDENRERFSNAEINTLQEQLISNERPSGPQSFNISGGINTIGETKPINLLKSQENRHTQNINNISSNIPSKSKIGKIKNIRHKYSENVNNRETNDFTNIVDKQLEENPFYNLRRQ